MKLLTALWILALLMCGLSGASLLAQSWDYLDVNEGYETLNLAIEGDTTAAGEPKSLNRVYRLARGGAYLLNGTISNVKGSPLRIFAAEGNGPKPMIIMAVDETGASQTFAETEGNTHLKNIYVCGTDMIGTDIRYGINIYGNGSRLILDGVQIDFSDQSHVKTYAKDCKIYHLNCEFRNGFLLNDMGRGRFFDARGLMPDSLVYINNTFYVNKQRVLRFDGAMAANVVIDHNTFYLNVYGGTASTATGKVSGPFELGRGIRVQVTNNIFQDMALEALRHPTTILPEDRLPIIPVDTVSVAAYPESNRYWLVRNNAYGWSPDVKAFWASAADSVKPPEFIGPWGMAHYFAGHKSNFIAENNFEEYIAFSDAPSVDATLNFVKYRFSSNFSDANNPDFRADRNGVSSLQENPDSFGPEDDPYNFDYPKTQRAYTAGDNGFPLGDLNWFPDKKAEWEKSGAGVDSNVPRFSIRYQLEQNYPNPFNPVTRIDYSMPKSAQVTLTIYNALGQEVARLLNHKQQTAGNHTIVWNSEMKSGEPAPSGVYYYQLRTNDQQITKKMILIK